jgi:glycosyltransferase involved in cell wall biosynthesis
MTVSLSSDASPTLSVIVPTHGRVELFRSTLDSLRRQATDAFELVVTDDSRLPEDRQSISVAVSAYARDTGRAARYVFTTPALGQAGNTNQGLRAARGDLLRILHSDDVLHPACLAWEISQFRDLAPLSLLFQDCIPFHDEQRIHWDAPPRIRLIEPADYFRQFLSCGTALPSGMVFSRAAFAEVGGMREDWHFLCDWDLFARLLLRCARRHELACYATAGHFGWRLHDESTTTRRWRDHYLEHAALLEEWRTSLAASDVDLFTDHRDRTRFFVKGRSYRRARLVADCRQLDWISFFQAWPWLLRHTAAGDWLKVGRKTLLNPMRRFRRRKVKPLPPHPFPAGDEHVPDLVIAADHSGDEVPIGSVGCVLPYDNTGNTWPLRQRIQAARRIRLRDFNRNRFYDRTLAEALKLVVPGTEVELRFHDNQHAAWFGAKALMTHLHPGRFQFLDQNHSPDEGNAKRHSAWSLRYRCVAGPKPWNEDPMTGVTIGILTLGTRLRELADLLSSVQMHCHLPHEVILVSPGAIDPTPYTGPFQQIVFTERDDLGWITRKKNLICDRATYSDIIVCHDRFRFTKDFFSTYETWGWSYGIAGPKVRLPNGRRALDWGIVAGLNHAWSRGALLEYRDYSRDAYIPGGITMIRKSFWRNFPWAEDLFWNEHEDVELCRRIQRSGDFLRVFPGFVTTTTDRWIDQNSLHPFDDQRLLS